jgi:hypothetical protein
MLITPFGIMAFASTWSMFAECAIATLPAFLTWNWTTNTHPPSFGHDMRVVACIAYGLLFSGHNILGEHRGQGQEIMHDVC